MTLTTCVISTGNDDFFTTQPDGGSVTYDYTSSTILASRNEVVSPCMTKIASMHINTAPIPDSDSITGATFYAYIDSYTASKRVTKEYTLQMLNSAGTTWVNVGSGTFTSAGWVSFALSSTQLTYIKKTGLTKFRFIVPSPGTLKTRDMAVRAYEYAGSYSAYLEVTHVAGSTYKPQVIMVAS